jgi:hypothetical protein
MDTLKFFLLLSSLSLKFWAKQNKNQGHKNERGTIRDVEESA